MSRPRKTETGLEGARASVWERYVTSGSSDDRDVLFCAYYGLVEHVARLYAQKVPSGAGVDVDDLAQAGSLGLVRAIEAHRDLWPEPFNQAGAKGRIRWAIRSELRSVDTESRRTRSRLSARKDAMSVLATRYSRMPSEEEIAQELQLSVRQTRTYLGEVARGAVRYLEAPSGSGSEQSIGDLLRDPALGPEALVEAGERVAAVGRAVKQLKERERFVVLASLVDGRRLADVGAELGLSEARVSQIRTAALGKLRRSLRSLDPAS